MIRTRTALVVELAVEVVEVDGAVTPRLDIDDVDAVREPEPLHRGEHRPVGELIAEDAVAIAPSERLRHRPQRPLPCRGRALGHRHLGVGGSEHCGDGGGNGGELVRDRLLSLVAADLSLEREMLQHARRGRRRGERHAGVVEMRSIALVVVTDAGKEIGRAHEDMFAGVASPGVHFSVVADDRTGALETAGACADVGFESVVVPYRDDVVLRADCVVVDLASRHLPSDEAALRARSAPAAAAHKIDSSLRGNWAHELVARHGALGRPVLVVPAFPAAGRTCRDGIVRIDGRPVADGAAREDARTPVRSSRPADHLRAAGAPSVVEVTPEYLSEWLEAAEAQFAVCDAEADVDLSRVAWEWASHRDVVIAGTAATIGAAAAALAPGRRGPVAPTLSGPALVVCGSLHPVAEAQVNALVAAGARLVSRAVGAGPAIAALRAGQHAVLTSGSFDRDATSTVSASLAEVAREVVASAAARTVVVIGGDTTAAVLGDEPMRVGGTLAPGVAWCVLAPDTHLVAKPGGFGDASTIVDLFRGAHHP